MIIVNTTSPCGGTATNITIASGETFDAGGAISVDLAGYTLKMQIAFPTPVLLTSTNGGIVIAPPSAYQFNIPDTSTESLPLGGYAYDAWMISPSGQATRILFGTFTVKAAVTPIP